MYSSSYGWGCIRNLASGYWKRTRKRFKKRSRFSIPIERTSSPDAGLIIWLILVSIPGVIIAIVCYRRKKNREQPVFVQAVQPQQIVQIMPQPVAININNSVSAAQEPLAKQSNENG